MRGSLPGGGSCLSLLRGGWAESGLAPQLGRVFLDPCSSPASAGRWMTQPFAFSMTCHPTITRGHEGVAGGLSLTSLLLSWAHRTEQKAAFHIPLPRPRAVTNSPGKVPGPPEGAGRVGHTGHLSLSG